MLDRQICLNCFSLIVAQFGISCGLSSLKPRLHERFLSRAGDAIFFQILGVFHLPRNSGNSGWVVNGTHVFGLFQWKISGINGTSEKV